MFLLCVGRNRSVGRVGSHRGAFAAGVVLDEVHYQRFLDRGERRVEELLFPISTLIVPVFFLVMGMRVDVQSLASPAVLGFAGLISLVAVLGK